MCLLRLKYVVDVDIIQRFEGQFDCLKPNGELVYFRIRILKNNAWQDWVVENGLGIWCYFWVLIVALLDLVDLGFSGGIAKFLASHGGNKSMCARPAQQHLIQSSKAAK